MAFNHVVVGSSPTRDILLVESVLVSPDQIIHL